MRAFLDHAATLLEQGEDLVLATIAGHAGSTPRTAGSKMAVRRDGSILGTIGGGRLEAEAMARARALFSAAGAALLRFDLTGSEAADAGMICGGRVQVLLEHLPATEQNASLFRGLAQAVAAGCAALLLTEYAGPDEVMAVLGRQAVAAEFHPDPLLDATLREAGSGAREPRLLDLEGRRFLLEPLAAACTAVLFGGGHVGLATARLASGVGFRTVVLDDRPEFANAERFPMADEVRVLSSFDSCLDGLALGPEGFALIFTRGHLHDKTVLSQVLRTPVGYVGMIGSRRKRDALYAQLRAEGFGDADFARVFCPVGLDIGAETPQEIAVSIVAQMIAVRAGIDPTAGDGGK
jgi:xanthine dehydrogenase accessory factor